MATESVDGLISQLDKSSPCCLADILKDAESFSGWSCRTCGKYCVSAKTIIEAYITRACARKVLEGRIEELKRLPWSHQNHIFSWNDVQDRIDELRAAIQEMEGKS